MVPLLQLSDIFLTHGGDPVFDGVDLIIQNRDRMALVGRNGSGKSTLMKIMAGLVEPDQGSRVIPSGVSVGYMEQDPDLSGFTTLGDFVIDGLDPSEMWRIESAAQGLDFDPQTEIQAASGGERRRAALARALGQAPDLLLLDEPTNHLDISAIAWLENALADYKGTFVLISHDRAVLRNLTKSTLWIDRGTLRRREAGFDGFEGWRDKIWEEEDLARHKLNRKIAAEARWAVEGISARRKRNQGRVRALAKLREDRAAQIKRQGTAAMEFEAGPASGRKVLEAKNISKSFDNLKICKDFSIRIMRGDRLAFVGQNGVGKTTLIEMLIGKVKPDSGSVTLGSNLEIAVFDQKRAALDPDQSLWENLTGDPEMRVSGQADQVMVRGQPRHVVGYLKDFLFDESRARAPVRSLSGGERARLLLAKLMARNSNFLILDEPTNDLDVETLDLLQELIGTYDGTVLLVSHDRDFLDRVAGMTALFEGDGRITLYAGGWSDMIAQRGENPISTPKPKKEKAAKKQNASSNSSSKNHNALSFTEKHRLEELPSLIERLGAEIEKLETLLSDPELFSREPVKFAKASEALTERQKKLSDAETEWLELMEKEERAG